MGRVFLVPTCTAFVPGACSVPGSAWDRMGRAALPLHERPPAGRACHSGRTRAAPGCEGSRAGAETVWAQRTKTGSTAILSLSEFSSPQAEPAAGGGASRPRGMGPGTPTAGGLATEPVSGLTPALATKGPSTTPPVSGRAPAVATRGSSAPAPARGGPPAGGTAPPI